MPFFYVCIIFDGTPRFECVDDSPFLDGCPFVDGLPFVDWWSYKRGSTVLSFPVQ